MKSTYVLKLTDKNNINRLLKYHVKFLKIKYFDNYCLLYVNEKDFQILKKYFDLYGITIHKIEGLLKYKKLLLKYYIFIISMIIGLIFLYFLSNITFDIKIMTNKEDLIKIIENELEESNLKKYYFIKSYNEKENIKKKILENYKDKVEWIEIDRVGTKYYVRVLERIINNKDDDTKYYHVVARKNAVISEIKASSGDIICKVNDYVNKGDIIISGLIKKKDEIKNIVNAKGQVYGETWYNVKVVLPSTYQDKIYTGNSYNRFSINIFNHRLFIFKGKRYLNEEYEDMVIINNKLLPFSLSKTKIKEIKLDTYFYNYADAQELGMKLAKDKLLSSLKEDSKILYQKKLKLYEENSTINIEVFFKVYEDITDYKEIVLEEGE